MVDHLQLMTPDSRNAQHKHCIHSVVLVDSVDEAIELCRKAHQPWRAPSICRSLLFQCRAIGLSSFMNHLRISELPTANGQRDDEDIDDTEDIEGRQETHVENYGEIPHLYATLIPCPQTFSVLKFACRTWETISGRRSAPFVDRRHD
ncbi:hypothetical protein EDB19DRAFT_544478 [Suillus lakei]|nr:hypothetical protein EDB19DRAFT_544478 [Suillus lakei]